MKIVDSRVISVRSARLSIVHHDGFRHEIDIDGPVTGTVEIGEDEIDTSTFGSPGESTPGRRTVSVDLIGALNPVQTLGKS